MIPLISVIINTYNYGNFVERAVQSVLEQDFPAEETEIIVVDDGSTDDTRERLRKYGDKIRYFYQENKGQAGAFNTGFANSSGELIALLDADDYWTANKLTRVVSALNELPEIGMVQHFMQEVDAKGDPVTTRFQARKGLYTLDDFLGGSAQFTGTSGLVFRRKFLQRLLPVPEELFYCADEYLYNIIFYAAVCSLNEVLGCKIIHGKNWFAGTISDALRLKNHVTVRKVILNKIEQLLHERNIDISDTRIALPLELLREETLYYSKTGKRSLAARALMSFCRRQRLRSEHIFVYLTLLAAIVSPRLYAGLYNAYSNHPLLYAIRKRIFK